MYKSVIHVQSCCFTNLNPCHSRWCCRRRQCWLSSLLLWSRNFATMVTWRHPSLLFSGRNYVKSGAWTLAYVAYDWDLTKKNLSVSLVDWCIFKIYFSSNLTQLWNWLTTTANTKLISRQEALQLWQLLVQGSNHQYSYHADEVWE